MSFIDVRCTYNVTMWCVRVTMFAMELQLYLPFILFLTYMFLFTT